MTSPLNGKFIRRGIRVHHLKSDVAVYRDVASGRKPFEVRPWDRDFQFLDYVVLREWDSANETYTGRWALRVITYVLYPGRYGLKEGYGVFAIERPESSDLRDFPRDMEEMPAETVQPFPKSPEALAVSS